MIVKKEETEELEINQKDGITSIGGHYAVYTKKNKETVIQFFSDHSKMTVSPDKTEVTVIDANGEI